MTPTPLVEQQRLLRDALDVLKLRGERSVDNPVMASMAFALIDHEDTGSCEAEGECRAVVRAREILDSQALTEGRTATAHLLLATQVADSLDPEQLDEVMPDLRELAECIENHQALADEPGPLHHPACAVHTSNLPCTQLPGCVDVAVA